MTNIQRRWKLIFPPTTASGHIVDNVACDEFNVRRPKRLPWLGGWPQNDHGELGCTGAPAVIVCALQPHRLKSRELCRFSAHPSAISSISRLPVIGALWEMHDVITTAAAAAASRRHNWKIISKKRSNVNDISWVHVIRSGSSRFTRIWTALLVDWRTTSINLTALITLTSPAIADNPHGACVSIPRLLYKQHS